MRLAGRRPYPATEPMSMSSQLLELAAALLVAAPGRERPTMRHPPQIGGLPGRARSGTIASGGSRPCEKPAIQEIK
jgi:hypothetical protein